MHPVTAVLRAKLDLWWRYILDWTHRKDKTYVTRVPQCFSRQVTKVMLDVCIVPEGAPVELGDVDLVDEVNVVEIKNKKLLKQFEIVKGKNNRKIFRFAPI